MNWNKPSMKCGSSQRRNGSSLAHWIVVLLSLVLLLGSVHAQGPATLTQSVTDGSQTLTLRMTRVDLRGAHFELWTQNGSGGFDVITNTAVGERSYLGTVDEYPDAYVGGILLDDGTFKGQVIFDRGYYQWGVLGSSVFEKRSDWIPDVYKYSTSTVSPGHGGATTYGFDVGVDARYEYFNERGGGSVAKTFEAIEYSVAVTRALYMNNALLRPYLSRVIIRASQAQDPYQGTTQGTYLDRVRDQWNTIQPAAQRDIVVGCTTTHVWAGLAWVWKAGTSDGVSVCDSSGDGNFSIVWRHEMGHNWGLYHYDGGAPEYGTINSNNHYCRMSGPELERVLSCRDGIISGALDNEGTFTAVNLPPYASYDSSECENGLGAQPVTIDVLANDHDLNGDALSILSFEPVSYYGGTITQTGSGSSAQLVYTPNGTFSGDDSFLYVLQDASGHTATGVVSVRVRINDNLHGYWTMDEPTSSTTFIDSSLYNNPGVSLGGVTAGAAGPFGNCASMDGIDDSIEISNSTGNPFNIQDEITLSAWIKVNAFDKTFQAILTKGDTSWRLLRAGDSNSLVFACNGLSNSALWGTVNVNDGQWHHVAGVYDGANMYLYIDGSLDVSQPATGQIAINSYPVRIGEDSQTGNRHWNGWIDEARVYSRALSFAEIQGLMDGGGAEAPNPFNGATGVGSKSLSWTPGAAATSHNIYVGSSASAVAGANTGSPEYQGSTSGSSFYAPSLQPNTTYYWRVDTVTSGGVIAGTAWIFQTGPSVLGEIIGYEDFAYTDGGIVDQNGGFNWDWDNIAKRHTGSFSDWDSSFGGAPQVQGETLITNNSGVLREYNGPGEALGTDEESGAFKGTGVVYYGVNLTPLNTNSWTGMSSCDFDAERLFFGQPGSGYFGIMDHSAGTSANSSIPVVVNQTYRLVAAVDFDGDQLRLWVDPDGSDYDHGTSDNTADVTLAYTSGNWSTAVRLASGGQTQWDNLLVALNFDAARVGVTDDIIGHEDFAYGNGDIVNQSGGINWDWDNGAKQHTGTASDWDLVFGTPPQVQDETLITNNSGVLREYNGPGEGGGTDEDFGAFKGAGVVYYGVNHTQLNSNGWSGMSCYDWDTERIFLGALGGNYGIKIHGGGATALSSIPVVVNQTDRLVAALDFDGDQLRLWINPDANDYDNGASDNTADVTLAYTGGNWNSALRLASSGQARWDDLVVSLNFGAAKH